MNALLVSSSHPPLTTPLPFILYNTSLHTRRSLLVANWPPSSTLRSSTLEYTDRRFPTAQFKYTVQYRAALPVLNFQNSEHTLSRRDKFLLKQFFFFSFCLLRDSTITNIKFHTYDGDGPQQGWYQSRIVDILSRKFVIKSQYAGTVSRVDYTVSI